MATAAAQPARRRVRKRVWIPLVLLGAMVLAVVWLGWRGTHADTVERNPASAADGAVTQLLTQDGHTFVRAAIVVPPPAAAVWPVVTDYESHPRFIRYISELSSHKLPDGRVRLTGVAHSRLWGDYPFESDVTQTEKPAEGVYAATWDDEARAGFRIDRGGWRVQRLGNDRVLLVLTLEMEIEGFPNFLVRNILLDRVGTIVEEMRDEIVRRNEKQGIHAH